jgi:hypothetical protein
MLRHENAADAAFSAQHDDHFMTVDKRLGRAWAVA